MKTTQKKRELLFKEYWTLLHYYNKTKHLEQLSYSIALTKMLITFLKRGQIVKGEPECIDRKILTARF